MWYAFFRYYLDVLLDTVVKGPKSINYMKSKQENPFANWEYNEPDTVAAFHAVNVYTSSSASMSNPDMRIFPMLTAHFPTSVRDWTTF